MTFDFLSHVNRAFSAGWVVAAVLLLRLLLKKAPRRFHCLLWALVALRLVLPATLQSSLSLQPSAEPVTQLVILPADISEPTMTVPVMQSGIPLLDEAVNPALSHAAVTVTGNGETAPTFTEIAAAVWICGVGAMLLYLLASWLRLRLTVREAAPLEGRAFVCDRIGTPFILGVFRPRIYLPSDLKEEDAAWVLAHERAHLRRGDHIWKPLGFLLLTIYWFQPLLWLGYVLLCRDIELACDEKVLAQAGQEGKKAYSTALINCSAPRRLLTACPLAFGESGVTQRVKAALHYKKPAFWLLLAASAAILATAVCFLTDPKQEEKIPDTIDEEITAEDENFFAQAVDLSGGVFTPRSFDFYTSDTEVLSALGLDESALTEERENTGVILLRGQTLGFAEDVDVRYDFYLGRLHSVRYQATVQPEEIDAFRARLAEQSSCLPDPADPEKTVAKLKTGSITWYDTLGNILFLDIIRNTPTDPNEPYFVYLNVKVSQDNLTNFVIGLQVQEPEQALRAWTAALQRTPAVLSGDPVRIESAVVEHWPEIEAIREEAIVWCWAQLYDTSRGNGYVVGPDTVYADTSAQSRIQAALLWYLIAQEDPDSGMKRGEPDQVYKQLWSYSSKVRSQYLTNITTGLYLDADWFVNCSVRYLAMVAQLRLPGVRIIVTPFERIAGKKDDVTLIWSTECFAKVLQGGQLIEGVTASDENLIADSIFCSEHARWQLAQLNDHIYTLTMTAPDGRILTLTYDATQNPPR